MAQRNAPCYTGLLTIGLPCASYPKMIPVYYDVTNLGGNLRMASGKPVN